MFVINIATAQIPTAGLVGYWPFNGNANDMSGNGNHGILECESNNPQLTTDRFGNANSAYEFGGYYNKNWIRVPNNSTMLLTDQMTISLWFQQCEFAGMDGWGSYSTTDAGFSVLTKAGDGIAAYPGIFIGSGINSQTGKLTISSSNCNGAASNPSYANYGVGTEYNCFDTCEWVHFVSTIDDTIAKIYLNGVLYIDTIINHADYTQANLHDLYIGRMGCNGFIWYPFNGKIDDVAFYNRALSDNEVAQLFGHFYDEHAFDNIITIDSLIVTNACNGNDGMVQIFPDTSNAPYLYALDYANNFQSSNIIQNISPGVHRIYIKSACGLKDTLIDFTCCLNPPVILHTPDTTIQAGNPTTLWASGADVLYWTDANGNILASGPTLTVSPTTSTMYYITGQNLSVDMSENVVVNGDFEQGNVGFTSAYNYVSSSSVLGEGYYTVGPNAHNYHPDFYNGFDHTSGTGNFMILNGAGTPNTNVWTQTVSVTPNTDYAFSTWVSSLVSGVPALLQFSVNGNQLGGIFTAPSTWGVWTHYYEVWNSGNNTSAVLTILNQNTTLMGNDFGIDDIVFAPLTSCSATESVLVSMASQLSATATATDNTDCIGRNCFYNGPTILINEVMLAPSSNDGSIAGGDNLRCGEWIELYNPHKCDSVDISCYFLGNNAPDYANYGGGFVIPPGSVVPPQGFALVRGVQTTPPNDSLLVQNGGNLVDIVVNSRYCVGGGTRLWFPNAGGWFAFYDANGVPQDAISWNNMSNSCTSCNPCNPGMGDCGFQGTLPSYSDIPATHKNYITSFDPESAGCLGKSFRRIPDGGAWQNTPSIPTYGTCNDVCVEPAETSCNAIAIVNVTGGIPPYTYQWDDNAGQTTDTAFALCAGTYTVTVTDALLNTAVAQVTVEDYQPVVTHPSSTYCLSDSSATLSGFPSGGTYEGYDLDGNTLHFHDSAAVYALTYTFADSNGCASTANFTVTVNPSYQVLIYDTICQRAPYDLHGFHLTSQQTDVAGLLQVDSLYQTANLCDSSIHLSLFVLPSEIITCDTAICKGEPFEGYGLTLMSDTMSPGSYQYAHVYQNQHGCDSMVTVNLTIHPVYDTRLDVDICQGEIYNQYGFQFNTDTMQVGTHEMVHDEVTSMGCDSVFLLNVNLLPSSQTFFSDTICQNTAYTGYGFTLSEDETATSGMNTFDRAFTNQFGCDSILWLNLYVKPVITPDFYADPDRAMLSESPVVHFVNNTNTVEIAQANYYWIWDFGDGSTDSTTVAETEHLYTQWGDYTVTLTLWADGCMDSASVTVFIEADLEFPNVITPNGDGINDVFIIKNLNPDRPNKLYISDRWGKVVWNKDNYQTYMKDGQIYNAESVFGMGDLSAGVYYYAFYYEGAVRTIRFNGSITIIK